MNAILIVLIIFLSSAAVYGESLDDVILEVTTQGGSVLSEPVVGLVRRQDVYLPLLDAAKALGIRIEQPSPTKFDIFNTPTESIAIETATCEKSKIELLCQNLLKYQNIDYISANYLKEQLMWPIQVDNRNMRLVVTTNEANGQHIAKNNDKTKPIDIKRDLFSTPAIHAELNYITPSEQKSASVYATNPLLRQDSTAFYHTDNQENTLRWTLSKEYHEITDTNMHPKSYEVLSVQSTDLKYLASPQQITGFKVTNRISGETTFDTQNIFEKGPPRWKVELFVNSIYIGETIIGADGLYSFLDVPIFYGDNKFIFKFTSPLGKTYEEVKNYNVTDDFSQSHKINYQIAYGQVEKSSDNIGNMQIDYGITSNVSLRTGLSKITYNDKQKLYSIAGASLLQSHYTVAVQNLSSLETNENALSISPRFNLAGIMLSTEYTKFNKLDTSLISPNQTSLKKVSALGRPSQNLPITAQLQFLESDFTNTVSVQDAQLRVYSMFDRSSILTEISKSWPSNESPDFYIEFGNYFSNFRIKYGSLFQKDTYSRSKIELENVITDSSYVFANAVLPTDINNSSYVLGFNSICGWVLCELQVIKDSQNISYGFLLSTNIRPNAPNNKVDPVTDYRLGRIEFFAYIDENANGVFDIDEKPYPRLRIMHIQTQKDYMTDSLGVVNFPAIQPYQRLSFEVVKESIPNIFLSARDFLYDYMPTPNQTLRIDVPIIPSFEIKGHVKNDFYKKLIPLQLIDNNGKIFSETTTSAKGAFLFEDVPAGSYLVRIQPAFLDKNQLVSNPQNIEIQAIGKAGVKSIPSISISHSQN